MVTKPKPDKNPIAVIYLSISKLDISLYQIELLLKYAGGKMAKGNTQTIDFCAGMKVFPSSDSFVRSR